MCLYYKHLSSTYILLSFLCPYLASTSPAVADHDLIEMNSDDEEYTLKNKHLLRSGAGLQSQAGTQRQKKHRTLLLHIGKSDS